MTERQATWWAGVPLQIRTTWEKVVQVSSGLLITIVLILAIIALVLFIMRRR